MVVGGDPLGVATLILVLLPSLLPPPSSLLPPLVDAVTVLG